MFSEPMLMRFATPSPLTLLVTRAQADPTPIFCPPPSPCINQDQDQDQGEPGQETLAQDLAARRLPRVGVRGTRGRLRGYGLGIRLGPFRTGLGDAVAK